VVVGKVRAAEQLPAIMTPLDADVVGDLSFVRRPASWALLCVRWSDLACTLPGQAAQARAGVQAEGRLRAAGRLAPRCGRTVRLPLQPGCGGGADGAGPRYAQGVPQAKSLQDSVFLAGCLEGLAIALLESVRGWAASVGPC
jgi:hypothetical protein